MKNLNDVYYVDLIGYCIRIQEAKQIPQKQGGVQQQQKKQNLISKLVNHVQPNIKIDEQIKIVNQKTLEQNKNEKEKLIKQDQQIISKQNKIIKLKMIKSSFLVFVPQFSIRKTIKIIIKTMFTLRRSINIQVSITTTIDALKKIIFQNLGENIHMFENIRLFYPSYTLLELTGTKTLVDQMIPANSKLVLLTKQIFTMIPPKNLGTLKFANNNLTITKTGDNNYCSIISNNGFQKTGRYYWQIKIENFQDEQDIFIGVADKDIDLTLCPTCAGNYWGYMPIISKKFAPQEQSDLIDYGYSIKLGDSIGVLLQFQKQLANVTFYKNGTSCGVAFRQIAGKLYPVVTLFSLAGITQVTIDPKAPCPLAERF